MKHKVLQLNLLSVHLRQCNCLKLMKFLKDVLCIEKKHQEKKGNNFVQRPNRFSEERCEYCLNFFQSHLIRLRRVALQDVNKFLFPSERTREFFYYSYQFNCEYGNANSLILLKVPKEELRIGKTFIEEWEFFFRYQTGSLKNSVHIFPTMLKVMRSSFSE